MESRDGFRLLGNHLPKISVILRLLLAPAALIAVLTKVSSTFNRNKFVQAGASWFFNKSTKYVEVLAMIHKQAARNGLPPTTRWIHTVCRTAFRKPDIGLYKPAPIAVLLFFSSAAADPQPRGYNTLHRCCSNLFL